MRIKDIILIVLVPLSLLFIGYNDYKIAHELQELNNINREYLIPVSKDRVEAVIAQYYREQQENTQVSVKSSPTHKLRAKNVKPVRIDVNNKKIIDDIAQYIKKKEGFRAHAYKDHGQYSIGYGTRASSHNEVITQKEANIRLYRHIKTVILPSFDGVVFQSIEQVHAAIDFSYNLGHNAFKRNIVRKDGAIDCEKMMAYNKVRDSHGNLIYNEHLAQRRLENFLACSAYEIIE